MTKLIVVLLVAAFALVFATWGVQAGLSADSVSGAKTCTVDQAFTWGLCLDTVRDNINASATSSQVDWNSANSTDQTLIEVSYYCNSVTNSLIAAAQCIQPCTLDGRDYLGRAQLTTLCESGLNVAIFAVDPNFTAAQAAYNCTTPPLTCANLITKELQKTLDQLGSHGSVTELTAMVAAFLAASMIVIL